MVQCRWWVESSLCTRVLRHFETRESVLLVLVAVNLGPLFYEQAIHSGAIY